MDFQQFKDKTRCSIQVKRQTIGHRHMRQINIKTFIVYIDIRTMKPFNPKTEQDALNCIPFRGEQSEQAKMKAWEFLSQGGHFQN